MVGIFGDEAKSHDITVGKISLFVIEQLEKEFPQLSLTQSRSSSIQDCEFTLSERPKTRPTTLLIKPPTALPYLWVDLNETLF